MSQGHTAFPLALYCGVVLLIAGSVAAQSTEWEALTSEARALYERGRYEQTAVTARKALALAERELGPAHPAVATSLNDLALIYRAQGRHAAAEPLFERSLAIFKNIFGPEHPAVATTLDHLALLYAKMGRHEESRKLGNRAEKIRGMKR